MSATARDLMSWPVTICRPWSTVNDAAHLMWTRDLGCVPVVDDSGALVGIVTDRDVCMAAYTRGAALPAILVEVAMSRVIVSCGPDDDVEVLLERMAQHKVRRVPVVDEGGGLVGIVSLCDLVRRATPDPRDSLGISSEAVLQTLEAICAPTWDVDDDLDAWEDDGGASTGVWLRVGGEAWASR